MIAITTAASSAREWTERHARRDDPPESDYAYAFFVEEYGIVLAIALLMLYLWIFFRGIEIFRRCGTAFQDCWCWDWRC